MALAMALARALASQRASRVSNWRPVDCRQALERLRHWPRAKLVELHLSGVCRTNAALVEGKRDEERDLAHQQGTAKLDGTGGEAVRMWVHSGRPRPPRLRAAKAAPYAAELLLSRVRECSDLLATHRLA